jgi:transposase
MGMPDTSLDLRRLIVAAYETGKTPSYEATAEMFGVGRATVNRLLRRKRETGDILPKAKGGNNPRRVDLDWLRKHAEEHPDARLIDRMAAWEQEKKKHVSMGSMWAALHLIGWSHKKRRLSPGSVTGKKSKRAARRSASNNPSSTSSD